MQAFGEQWNAMAARHGLASIDFIKSGSPREKSALARLADLRDDYSQTAAQFLERISRSAFLTGRKTDFRATFDGVIAPKLFVKIMEGNFENKETKSSLNGFGAHR